MKLFFRYCDWCFQDFPGAVIWVVTMALLCVAVGLVVGLAAESILEAYK